MAEGKETTQINNELKPNAGANKRMKRIGRGPGSGHGKTSCKGHKGQWARKGRNRPYVGFEGGQMPLARRLPKRGFFNRCAKEWAQVKTGDLNVFDEGETVSIVTLIESGLIHQRSQKVKVIFGGDLIKKLKIQVDRASKGALESIKKSGSSLELLEAPIETEKVVKKKKKK